jgi:hypothetical protein
MRAMWNLLRALALLAVVALLTVPAAEAVSIQSVCSSTGLAAGGLPAFATDPVSGPERCIGGPGAVSSSRSSSGPERGIGGFWDAGSTISADAITGFSFSGFAHVAFSTIPARFGISAVAATGGQFRDQVTILPPPGVSGRAELVIPMHVTGSASTVGAVVATPGNIGIQHTAEFQYGFVAFSGSLLGRSQDTIGLTTTAETLVCGPAACGPAPVLFNQTQLVALPFVFGETFFIDASFTVDAFILPNGPPDAGFLSVISATADFSHTVTFGPATVVDASGNVIPGVTIVSDIDYLAGTRASVPIAPGPIGVPEPSTLVLLASTLIAGGAARRMLR